MKKKSDSYGLPKENVEQAIKVGLFNPEDKNCTKRLKLEEPLNWDWFNPELDIEKNKISTIKNLSASLFKLFADPSTVQNRAYNISSTPLSNIIDSLKSGNWAPQCAGISKIARRIINESPSDIVTSVLEIDYPEHTLNLLCFKEQELWYAVVADFQNGFLFPIQKESGHFYTLSEIQKLSTEEIKFNTEFWWLAKETQHKKRNLLQEVLPCNYLSDDREAYHKAPLNSPYKYERLSFSFHKHYWFDLNALNIDSLKIELSSRILENTCELN